MFATQMPKSKFHTNTLHPFLLYLNLGRAVAKIIMIVIRDFYTLNGLFDTCILIEKECFPCLPLHKIALYGMEGYLKIMFTNCHQHLNKEFC